MKVLVDADTIAYRVAYSKEVRGPKDAERKVDEEVERIKQAVNPYLDDEYFNFYLTGKGNFRFDYDETYKGQRTSEKPILLYFARDYFVDVYGATVSQGQEADDVISIEANKHDWHDVIVVSIDKDFRQVPCQLYNPLHGTWESIDPWSGKVNFYEQMLVGDRSDNVVGVMGIGKVKAKKFLETATTEKELWDRCLAAYEGDYDRCLSNARMLHLRTYEGEIWEPPSG